MEKGGDAGLITNRQRSALIVCQRLLFSTYIDTPSSISSGYMEETFLRQIFSPFFLAPESVALPANKWWPSRMAREWIESIGGAQRAFSPGGFFLFKRKLFVFSSMKEEKRVAYIDLFCLLFFLLRSCHSYTRLLSAVLRLIFIRNWCASSFFSCLPFSSELLPGRIIDAPDSGAPETHSRIPDRAHYQQLMKTNGRQSLLDCLTAKHFHPSPLSQTPCVIDAI